MGHKINLRNYFLHKLFYTPKIVAKLQKKVNDFAVKSDSKKIRGLGILPYGNLRVVPVAEK